MNYEAILLPKDLIIDSPSHKMGISWDDEVMHRIFGCELIQEASMRLRLAQVVAVTGQHLLHRYYYRKSLTKFDAFSVAMGCFLLSSKVEETPRTVRDVINIFHEIYQRRRQLKLKSLDMTTSRYNTWKNEVVMIERFILKELGFSFYNVLDHPHKYILYLIKLLDCSPAIAQTAWNYLNDSMRLDLPLRYEAKVIACAAVYLAIHRAGVHFPEEAPWWSLLVEDKETLLDVCDAILSLYHRPKVFPASSLDGHLTCVHLAGHLVAAVK